jgi:hypothetical protein
LWLAANRKVFCDSSRFALANFFVLFFGCFFIVALLSLVRLAAANLPSTYRARALPCQGAAKP